MTETVELFMKKPPISVDEDTRLIEAIRTMRKNSIGSVLVMNKGRLTGIFTDKDVVQKISITNIDSMLRPIRDFMSGNPVTIQKNESHNTADALMKKNNFRHLPVFDKDKLVGIISIRDLAHFLEGPRITPEETRSEGDGIKPKELSGFQMRNIEILAYLFEHDAISDEVVEYLRESELEHFSLIEKYRFLEKRVNIDEKTNLLKHSNNYIVNIIKAASRILAGVSNSYTVSFIRFDIDDFSVFNSRYGHNTGDEALLAVAQFLKENTRSTDYAIRFGGEEFDLILPNTKPEGLVNLLEKIYKRIDKLSLPIGGNKVKIGVSAGASTYEYILEGREIDESAVISSYEKMQREADDALYEAKSVGKERYSVFTPGKEEYYRHCRSKYNKRTVSRS